MNNLQLRGQLYNRSKTTNKIFYTRFLMIPNNSLPSPLLYCAICVSYTLSAPDSQTGHVHNGQLLHRSLQSLSTASRFTVCSIKGLIKFDFSVSVYIHVRVICVRMGSSRRHRAVFFFAVLRDVAMTRAHNFGACAHHDLRLLEWLFDLLHPFLKFSLGLKDETFLNEFLISLSNNGYQKRKGTNKINLEMFSVLSRAKVWG